jgi:hypothetical protein
MVLSDFIFLDSRLRGNDKKGNGFTLTGTKIPQEVYESQTIYNGIVGFFNDLFLQQVIR